MKNEVKMTFEECARASFVYEWQKGNPIRIARISLILTYYAALHYLLAPVLRAYSYGKAYIKALIKAFQDV